LLLLNWLLGIVLLLLLHLRGILLGWSRRLFRPAIVSRFNPPSEESLSETSDCDNNENSEENEDLHVVNKAHFSLTLFFNTTSLPFIVFHGAFRNKQGAPAEGGAVRA